MQTRRSLRNVITRNRGLAASARRAPSPGTARAQIARRIAVPALVLVSFGATAAASPGAGHAARAQHPAGTRVNAVSFCAASKTALAHAAKRKRPWMYAVPAGRPWMYAPAGKPWMYAVPAGRPWMYAKINGRPTRSRACPKAARQVAA